MLKMVGEAEEIPTVAFSLLSQVLRGNLSLTSVCTCVSVAWAFIGRIIYINGILGHA